MNSFKRGMTLSRFDLIDVQSIIVEVKLTNIDSIFMTSSCYEPIFMIGDKYQSVFQSQC